MQINTQSQGKQSIQQALARERQKTMPGQPGSTKDAGNDTFPTGLICREADTCPQCGGIGWLRSDAPQGDVLFVNFKLIRCSCRAQEDAARLQRLSGLSERERTIRLDDIDVTDSPGTCKMVAALREFSQLPIGMISIHGTPGNAKTTGLQAVVNELRSLGIEAVYVTMFDLISHVREAFNDKREVKSESAYERLTRWEQVRVLAIDEFDKVNHQTDWVLDQLIDLVDKRYRSAMDGTSGTLIAMNDNLDDLPCWISSRLRDNLNQVIENLDPDMRSTKGS